MVTGQGLLFGYEPRIRGLLRRLLGLLPATCEQAPLNTVRLLQNSAGEQLAGVLLCRRTRLNNTK